MSASAVPNMPNQTPATDQGTLPRAPDEAASRRIVTGGARATNLGGGGGAQVRPTPSRETRRDDFLVRLMTIELFLVMLTQKLAVPLGAEAQFQSTIAIHFVVMMLCAAKSYVRLNAVNAIIYLVVVGVGISVNALFHASEFSPTSLLLFSTIYAGFIFVLPISRDGYFRILRNFQWLAVLVACLVWFDWAIQFAGIPMPNIETVIDKILLYKQFAYMQPLVYGSKFFKPNAIVFLETSYVGQFIAMGFIIEVCFFRRMTMMAFLFPSILVTFSGTGMLLVLACSPLMLPYLRAKVLLGLMVAAPLALISAASLGVIDNAEKRLTQDFDRKGSSGQQRFLAPLETMEETLAEDLQTAVVGVGAGNIAKGFNIMWIPVAKALKEYGLIFFVLWFGMTVVFFFGAGRPVVISWMMFIVYHVCNGSLLVPLVSAYCYLLAAGYMIQGYPDVLQRGMVDERRQLAR